MAIFLTANHIPSVILRFWGTDEDWQYSLREFREVADEVLLPKPNNSM
tara:strand:+ start:444 stop:587 length:144 start_codon:yes stop_codon:yes gene_type:complete